MIISYGQTRALVKTFYCDQSCPSPVLVQSLDFFMSRFWSGTRFESGLGLVKIQISVLKLENLEKLKIEFENSKKSKNSKFEKIEI